MGAWLLARTFFLVEGVWVMMKLLFSLIGGFTCRALVSDLVAWCSVAQIAVHARRSVQVFCLDESLMSTLTGDSQKLCTRFEMSSVRVSAEEQTAKVLCLAFCLCLRAYA